MNKQLLQILDQLDSMPDIEVDYTQVRRFMEFYDSLEKTVDNQDGALGEPTFSFNGANIEVKFYFFDILECDIKFREVMHYCSAFSAEVMPDDRVLLSFTIPNLFKKR